MSLFGAKIEKNNQFYQYNLKYLFNMGKICSFLLYFVILWLILWQLYSKKSPETKGSGRICVQVSGFSEQDVVLLLLLEILEGGNLELVAGILVAYDDTVLVHLEG